MNEDIRPSKYVKIRIKLGEKIRAELACGQDSRGV